MTLPQPQRDNVERVLQAYCAKTGHDRADLKPDLAPTIAETMGVHIHANVTDAIAQVISGN